MAFEFIPLFLFGLLFLVIGLKLSNNGAFGLLKLGLIIGGIILFGWSIFAGWTQIIATLN